MGTFRTFRIRSASLRDGASGAAAIEIALLAALVIGAGFLAFEVFSKGDAASSSAPASIGEAGAHNGADLAPSQKPVAAGSWNRAVLLATLICLSISLFVLRRRTTQLEASMAEKLVPPEFRSAFAQKRQEIRRFLHGHAQSASSSVKVRLLMTQNVSSVTRATGVEQIQQMMAAGGIRHLLVTSGDGTLAGVISDRDLNNRRGAKAEDIMTRDPITATPDTPAQVAITCMLNHRISCLPVIENERVCGVVTTTDVMMAFQCALQLLEQIATPVGEIAATDAALDQLEPVAS